MKCQSDADGSNGFVGSTAVGAGDARDGQGEIGAGEAACPAPDLLHDGNRDSAVGAKQFFWHRQHRGFGGVAVGDPTLAEKRLEPGISVRYLARSPAVQLSAVATESDFWQAFRRRQQPGFVNHDHKSNRPMPCGKGVGAIKVGQSGRATGGAGVEAKRDDASRNGCTDGGVAIAIHEIAKHLRNGTFTQAKSVKGSGDDDGAIGGGDVRRDISLVHEHHFLGDAGHDEDSAGMLNGLEIRLDASGGAIVIPNH